MQARAAIPQLTAVLRDGSDDPIVRHEVRVARKGRGAGGDREAGMR